VAESPVGAAVDSAALELLIDEELLLEESEDCRAEETDKLDAVFEETARLDDENEEMDVDATEDVFAGLLLTGGGELLPPPLPPQAVSNIRTGASDRYLVIVGIRINKNHFTGSCWLNL
jgi:hypothetical protein